MSRIHSLLDTLDKTYATSTSSKQPRLVTWNPPSDSYIKLNVDGSYFGNLGRSGFGGLFCNHIGNWMLCFSNGCGYTTNTSAALQEIAHGLELLDNKATPNLFVNQTQK